MKTKSTAPKTSASTTVDHASRDVTACAGTVIANAIGTRNVTLIPQPARIDRDREAARLVDALEELDDVPDVTIQNASVASTSQKQ